MKKNTPFKVMTASAIAATIAVPAVASSVSAAEVNIETVAIEMDGTTQVVTYTEFTDAFLDGEGEVYELATEGNIVSFSTDGESYISYEALVDALFDADEDQDTADVIAELEEDEDAMVPADEVAEYKDYPYEEPSTPMVESVSAINAKTLEVDFSQDLDADQLDALEFEVTRDGSSQLFEVADTDGDKVHLVRTNDADLQAGDYTVTVNGLGEEALTATTTVDAQVATTLDINASNLTDNNSKAKVGISLADQYGDDLDLQQSDFTVTAFNQTQDQSVNVQFDSANDYFYVNTASVKDDFKVGDEVSVTFLHEETGLKATKTLTVVKGSQLDSVSLGDVMLPEDTNLLTEDLEDVKVPYTAMDQYGNDVTLSSSNVEVISSNENIVMESDVSFTTEDDEPVLNIAKFGEAGTVTLTLLNKVNGETATVTLEVNEQAGTAYAVSLDQTSVEVAANGSQALDLTVTDKYGNEVDPADYVADTNNDLMADGFTVVTSNDSVATAKIDMDEDSTTYGDVLVKAEGNQGQSATVTVTLNSTGDSVTSDVTIGEAATPFNIEVAEDSKHSNSLVVGSTTTVDFSVFDQYENDAADTPGEYEVRYSFEEDNGSDYLSLDAKTDSDIEDASLEVTADAAGSATVVASLVDTSGDEDEVLDTVEVSFTTVANSSDSFDYEVVEIPTLYKNGDGDNFDSDDTSNDGLDTDDDGIDQGESLESDEMGDNEHAQAIQIQAVDSDGSTLDLPNSAIINVSALTDNVTVAEASDGTWYVAGSAEGITADETGKIRVNITTDEGTQTIDQEVTISAEDLQTSDLTLMSETVGNADAEELSEVTVTDYDTAITFNSDNYVWATDQFGVKTVSDLTSATASANAFEDIKYTSDDTFVASTDTVTVSDVDGDNVITTDEADYRLTLIEDGVALDINVNVDGDKTSVADVETDSSEFTTTIADADNELSAFGLTSTFEDGVLNVGGEASFNEADTSVVESGSDAVAFVNYIQFTDMDSDYDVYMDGKMIYSGTDDSATFLDTTNDVGKFSIIFAKKENGEWVLNDSNPVRELKFVTDNGEEVVYTLDFSDVTLGDITNN